MNLQDELFNSNVRVENVIVKGLKRTNEHIVMRELENVKRSGTLEEIKDSLFDVHANLMNLGIFKAVDISIDEGIRKVCSCRMYPLHFAIDSVTHCVFALTNSPLCSRPTPVPSSCTLKKAISQHSTLEHTSKAQKVRSLHHHYFVQSINAVVYPHCRGAFFLQAPSRLISS